MKYKIGNELLMLIDKLSIKVMSQGISQLVLQGTRDQNETETILFFLVFYYCQLPCKHNNPQEHNINNVQVLCTIQCNVIQYPQ